MVLHVCDFSVYIKVAMNIQAQLQTVFYSGYTLKLISLLISKWVMVFVCPGSIYISSLCHVIPHQLIPPSGR